MHQSKEVKRPDWELEGYSLEEILDPNQEITVHGHEGYRESEGYLPGVIDEVRNRLDNYAEDQESTLGGPFDVVSAYILKVSPAAKRQLRDIREEVREEF